MFAQGATNSDDFNSIHGGIRIHFGAGQKSLIRRHREDDPSIWLAGTIKKGTEVATFKKVQREEKRLREIAEAEKDKQRCKEGYVLRASNNDTIDSSCVPPHYLDFTDEQVEQAHVLSCDAGLSPYAYNDVVACHPSQPIGLLPAADGANWAQYLAENPPATAYGNDIISCSEEIMECKPAYLPQSFMGQCRCLPPVSQSENMTLLGPNYYSGYLASLYVYENL